MLRRFAAAAILSLAAGSALSHEQLGANLNFVADYMRNHEFNDLVKQSRAFLKAGSHFNDSDPNDRAAVGPDGWPIEDFKLFVMAAQAGATGLGGTYKLRFTATTQPGIVVTGGALQNLQAIGGNNFLADVVVPEGADTLFLDFTATAGSVKNLRLLRPGVLDTDTPLLNTAWVAHAGRFHVLRFMDWMRTNGNRHVTWADRTTPQKLRTEALIANWETVIATANALGRDPWINIPVLADDGYVTNLATLLRDMLGPNLNVYVEYGNELWNFGIHDEGLDNFHGDFFNPATKNRELAAASPPDSPLRFEPATDTTLGFRRVALRLKQISDIFASVWGPGAINTRVRPVLAGQMGNSDVVAEGLRLVDEGLNVRPHTVFYAIAGAPYIFPSANADGSADETPGLTKDQILDGMEAGVANAPSPSVYKYLAHAGLGAWYGVKVLAYEAGFDNFGGENVPAKRQANLDPRIKTICRTYLDQWHSQGFGMLMWFNAGAASFDTQFGMWPLLEDMGSPAHPKNQCMDETFAAALPAVAVGTNATGGPIAGGNYTGSATPSGSVTGNDGPFGFPGYVEYLLRVTTPGTYNLVFTGAAAPSERFRVLLSNALVAGLVSLPASTGPSATFQITLRKGLNALRLQREPGTGTSWRIDSFSISLVAAASALRITPGALDFGVVSMGTNSAQQTVTLTNDGATALTITDVVTPSDVQKSHDCTTLDPDESCTITVVFRPAPQNVALTATATANSSLQVASNAPGSPHTVSITAQAERSLVTHYYRSILRRAPDASGHAFWNSEAQRMAGIGANVNETWFAMAQFFYFSGEYIALARSDTGFVTDLYATFFNRAPDGGGLAFWTGQLGQGMPREVVLAGFMFSPEFVQFTQGIFGNTAARAEVDAVMDFYRGLLARLPDGGGFNFWVQRFRGAQCQGAAAVNAEAESISSAFATSGEYGARGRSNAQYVGDLYNSILRRGGDLQGVQFWIGQLDAQVRSRENVRQNFIASSEFQGRVNAIIAQGCVN